MFQQEWKGPWARRAARCRRPLHGCVRPSWCSSTAAAPEGCDWSALAGVLRQPWHTVSRHIKAAFKMLTTMSTVESSGRAGSVLRSFSSTVRWGCCCSRALLNIAKVLGGLFRASSVGSACSLRGSSRPGSGLNNCLSHTRRPFPFVVQFMALSKVKDVDLCSGHQRPGLCSCREELGLRRL